MQSQRLAYVLTLPEHGDLHGHCRDGGVYAFINSDQDGSYSETISIPQTIGLGTLDGKLNAYNLEHEYMKGVDSMRDDKWRVLHYTERLRTKESPENKKRGKGREGNRKTRRDSRRNNWKRKKRSQKRTRN